MLGVVVQICCVRKDPKGIGGQPAPSLLEVEFFRCSFSRAEPSVNPATFVRATVSLLGFNKVFLFLPWYLQQYRYVDFTVVLSNCLFLLRSYSVQPPESMSPTAATEAYSKALAVCHGPLDHYDFLIKARELKDDEHQRRVIQCLQKLHEDLKGYRIEEEGLFSKDVTAAQLYKIVEKSLKALRSTPPFCQQIYFTGLDRGGYQYMKFAVFSLFSRSKPPRGLYVYGDVGTGKTMVMDMFYAYVEMKRKKRVHFHGFMLDVHQRIHRLKQSLPKRKPGFMAKSYDPIAPIAEEISEEACLLCFDEFQVTDIADAMILKQLFENLFKNGVVVVATSNRPPEAGAAEKEYCNTVQLDSGIDYRKRELPAAGKLYYLTSEADVEAVMDKLFDELAQKQNDLTRPRILKVQGRELRLNKACGTVADCTFEELCERPLGASDYLELSRNFDTVFLRNIPQFTLAKRTQARRFITLIDNFYDFKVRIICSASTPISSLFLYDHHDSELEQSRILMDDLGLSQDSAEGLAMFTGEEEIFAFQRTISRLTEMQTEQYWNEGDRSKKALASILSFRLQQFSESVIIPTSYEETEAQVGVLVLAYLAVTEQGIFLPSQGNVFLSGLRGTSWRSRDPGDLIASSSKSRAPTAGRSVRIHSHPCRETDVNQHHTDASSKDGSGERVRSIGMALAQDMKRTWVHIEFMKAKQGHE
ncbi:hypothetical protein MJG53_008888 [Ovis ammon polii x Ovis aries]|uniref:Uncharacterized protein n=1 Tax=Ovis ammon polii x Ovis aries TaxID=2918886 RepID=A0ACB9UY13_9CETA|nr:hypothetical protein MJT46_008524 [Ovis ammon polii x Ovis aries]KAI4582337.1 hypothetical protein MJG53_008888 [Ovis ammon polii x Ovis aries]